jgi:hypothetical protein
MQSAIDPLYSIILLKIFSISFESYSNIFIIMIINNIIVFIYATKYKINYLLLLWLWFEKFV